MSLVGLVRRAAVSCFQYHRQPVAFGLMVSSAARDFCHQSRTDSLNRVSQSLLSRSCGRGIKDIFETFAAQQRQMGTINQERHRKPIKRKTRTQLRGKTRPHRKAVVIRPMVLKPKKPNSGQRKVVRCRVFKTGEVVLAYVPGVGHSLQEHHIVLLESGKVPDTPGIKFKCIRGKYDLGHPVKRAN